MGTEEYKGYTVKIEQDDGCSMDSRDWDNLGTMICFHNRYQLGDKHELRSADFNGWDEVKAYIIKEYNLAVILPLYLYDHSGLRIKVGSFAGLLPQGHAEFDSGMVGFIFVSKEKAREEYGWKRINKVRIEKLTKYLTSEVSIYDQDLRGDVWYYVITKEDDPEVDESLSGLYGYDYTEGEAKALVDGMIEHEQKICGVQQKIELVTCSGE